MYWQLPTYLDTDTAAVQLFAPALPPLLISETVENHQIVLSLRIPPPPTHTKARQETERP